MAFDIYHFMILQNLDKYIIAGMLMGGAVEIQFAIQFHNKLKSTDSYESWTRDIIFKRFLF